jgi:mono/diheme cytochrome c family protein
MPLTRFHLACGAALLAVMLPLQAQDMVPAPTAAATDLVADMDNATTIWDHACAACHGELGQGVQSGVPDIRNSALSLSQITLVVKTGSNTMPAFAGFTQQELLDISTYVMEAL